MKSGWPALPFDAWSETCDTLHAHTQVLGKLAAYLAPPEPQLQHAALRLTARGWETAPLPAPDGSGAFVAALDLHESTALVEHVDGRRSRVALTPDRPVADVTREVLGAVRELAGAVEIDLTPQEVPWSAPLDEDREHARYDGERVRPKRSRSAGGRVIRDIPGRPSTPMRTLRRRALRARRYRLRRPVGKTAWAYTSSIGRTWWPRPIRTTPHFRLRALPSTTPAPCAPLTRILRRARERTRSRSGGRARSHDRASSDSSTAHPRSATIRSSWNGPQEVGRDRRHGQLVANVCAFPRT
jgi:hypothetical protein